MREELTYPVYLIARIRFENKSSDDATPWSRLDFNRDFSKEEILFTRQSGSLASIPHSETSTFTVSVKVNAFLVLGGSCIDCPEVLKLVVPGRIGEVGDGTCSKSRIRRAVYKYYYLASNYDKKKRGCVHSSFCDGSQ